jgi:hypothetical protein
MRRICLRIFLIHSIISITLVKCGGDLVEFINEDRPLVLQILTENSATPAYSVANQTLSFSVTFRLDRKGNYEILHGNNCSGGKSPAGIPLAGTVHSDPTTEQVTILLDDIATYGSSIVVCASDTAQYQKASQQISFASGLAYLASLNEQTGGSIPISDSFAGEFVFFQPDWTSWLADRGSSTNSQGINNAYYHAVFVDPNDNYKFKYFVADSGNHRILIFHTLPKDSNATADVVIGQVNFTGNSPNGGGSVSASGFKLPAYLAVSAEGVLYVADAQNNRVLIFKQIPKTNGAAADIVIGQPNMADNTANNFLLPQQAQRLSIPTAVAIHSGKLYISDGGNNRILVFNTLPTANAPAADMAIGQADTDATNAGTDYTSNSDYLNLPFAVYFSEGRMYAADVINNRFLVFNSIPAAADTRPNYVLGQMNSFTGSSDCGGSVNAQCFNNPAGVTVQNNRLAIADNANNRVLFFALPVTSNGIAAQAVLGQVNMTSSASATTQTGLNMPISVVYSANMLWILDNGNNRVVVRQLP